MTNAPNSEQHEQAVDGATNGGSESAEEVVQTPGAPDVTEEVDSLISNIDERIQIVSDILNHEAEAAAARDASSPPEEHSPARSDDASESSDERESTEEQEAAEILASALQESAVDDDAVAASPDANAANDHPEDTASESTTEPTTSTTPTDTPGPGEEAAEPPSAAKTTDAANDAQEAGDSGADVDEAASEEQDLKELDRMLADAANRALAGEWDDDSAEQFGGEPSEDEEDVAPRPAPTAESPAQEVTDEPAGDSGSVDVSAVNASEETSADGSSDSVPAEDVEAARDATNPPSAGDESTSDEDASDNGARESIPASTAREEHAEPVGDDQRREEHTPPRDAGSQQHTPDDPELRSRVAAGKDLILRGVHITIRLWQRVPFREQAAGAGLGAMAWLNRPWARLNAEARFSTLIIMATSASLGVFALLYALVRTG